MQTFERYADYNGSTVDLAKTKGLGFVVKAAHNLISILHMDVALSWYRNSMYLDIMYHGVECNLSKLSCLYRGKGTYETGWAL